MKSARWLTLVLLVALLLAAAVPVLAGPSAQGGRIQYGQTVNGMLSGDQGDRWLFTGTAGDTVLILMESDVFDTYLELLDSTGSQFAYNDDSSGSNSALTIALPASGDYTIVARAYGTATGAYTLSLQQAVVQPITVGQTVTATLAGPTGDRWSFSASAGDGVMVAMESSDFDTYLELYDASNVMVGYNDDAGGTDRSRLGYVIPITGTYTIVARGYSTDAAGSYTLSLMPAQAQIEPQPITVGGTGSGMLVNPTGDRWFFDGMAGMAVVIDLVSDDFDTVLQLQDASGSAITENDDGGAEYNSSIGYILPATATYNLVVLSYQGGAGAYTLTISVTEPRPIGYGETISGTLGVPAVQLWSFAGMAGDMLNIGMNSDDFDTYLVLFGPDGSEVSRNDDGPIGYNALIQGATLPDTGTYTIAAHSYGRDQGDYTLSLATSVVETMEIGQTITGTLSDPGGARWQFTAPANTGIMARVSSDDFDTVLELLDGSGNQIAYNDDSDGSNSAIGAALQAGGTYTLVVNSYSGGTGDYTLSLMPVQTQTSPQPITLDQPVDALLGNPQGDRYYFSGTAGDTI
ncbi:MAG: PPC domain-containing protein, partial [Anaerolineae bacterium]|nr:PPC domain-containing protein [Anaerolineae bacterium]